MNCNKQCRKSHYLDHPRLSAPSWSSRWVTGCVWLSSASPPCSCCRRGSCPPRTGRSDSGSASGPEPRGWPWRSEQSRSTAVWPASSGPLEKAGRTSSAPPRGPQPRWGPGRAAACRSVEAQTGARGSPAGRWRPGKALCWSRGRWTRGKGWGKTQHSRRCRRRKGWCAAGSAVREEGSNSHCTCWVLEAPGPGLGTEGHNAEETVPGSQMKTSTQSLHSPVCSRTLFFTLPLMVLYLCFNL